MIVYKVVRKAADGNFVSSTIQHAKLTYRIGKTTYPKIKNSKIFVFEDLQDATDFIEGDFLQRLVILKCKTNQTFPRITACHFQDSAKALEEFWNSGMRTIYKTPPNSQVCDYVVPLERVTDDSL